MTSSLGIKSSPAALSFFNLLTAKIIPSSAIDRLVGFMVKVVGWLVA